MAVSIHDVAKMAGVSVSTVSKALNGTGAVAESTAKAIRNAATALHYAPNERARSLATKANHQIIFLADFPFDAAFVNPHLFEIMLGVKLKLVEIVSSPHDTEGREPCAFRFRVLTPMC